MDECFGGGFDRRQSISLGLRDRFRKESRRRRFLRVVTDDRRTSKSFPAETLGLDSETTDERIDFSLDPIVEHWSERSSTLHREQSGGLHVFGKSEQWLSLSRNEVPLVANALLRLPSMFNVSLADSFTPSLRVRLLSALWSECLRLIIRWQWISLDRSS